MTPQTVLASLIETGVRIELENGHLRYHSPTPLDDRLLGLIRTHKPGLLHLLEAKGRPISESDDRVVPLPELSGHGFSESELPALRTIYQTTIDKGHALHKCIDAEQAQRWADWLNTDLPDDRECFVIRNREVNCYTVTDEVHPSHNDVANAGDNSM